MGFSKSTPCPVRREINPCAISRPRRDVIFNGLGGGADTSGSSEPSCATTSDCSRPTHRRRGAQLSPLCGSSHNGRAAHRQGYISRFRTLYMTTEAVMKMFLLLSGVILMLQPLHKSVQQPTSRRDGQHDFDFEIGRWKTHLSRLVHPLTGSTTWVQYDGTTVVRPVWNGRANLVELEADGPGGHFEGLSLRLYNPASHQLSLNFASSSTGVLAQPSIGEFKNERGEFYDQEALNGRAILVRFVIMPITVDSCRFEQAYSDDGGKTWEVNWIATDTRVR